MHTSKGKYVTKLLVVSNLPNQLTSLEFVKFEIYKDIEKICILKNFSATIAAELGMSVLYVPWWALELLAIIQETLVKYSETKSNV